MGKKVPSGMQFLILEKKKQAFLNSLNVLCVKTHDIRFATM